MDESPIRGAPRRLEVATVAGFVALHTTTDEEDLAAADEQEIGRREQNANSR